MIKSRLDLCGELLQIYYYWVIIWNIQEFLHGSVAELMNKHVLEDSAGVAGQVIVELGRAETYLLRCARNQAGTKYQFFHGYSYVSLW